MSDQTVVHMGENSPQEVAYRLMKDVLAIEGKLDHPNRSISEAKGKGVDRAFLLDLYAECVEAANNRRRSGDGPIGFIA